MGLLGKLLGIAPKKQPVHIDDSNFTMEVARSELPVLLDVWGPSCVHCQRLEPIIMELAAEYEGRVKIAEVNAAASPITMSKLGVRGTPTVIYFDRGKEVERVVGFRAGHYHRDFIDNELLPAPSGGTSEGEAARGDRRSGSGAGEA